MENAKILFCDLDGTLIDTLSGETFPKGVWDMRFKMDIWEAIKKHSPKYILIATNQGGIESGFVNEDNFVSKMNYVSAALKEYVGCDKVLYNYCTTNNKGCLGRKPNTGMYVALFDGLDMRYAKEDCLAIGDASGKPGQFSDSDKVAAERFGCRYMDVEDFLKDD